MERDLYHSAKGTHWTKKNHKYVAKENGRYIYPEDKNGNNGIKLFSKKQNSNTPQIRSKKAFTSREKENQKIAETNKRLDAEERLNQRQKYFDTKARLAAADTPQKRANTQEALDRNAQRRALIEDATRKTEQYNRAKANRYKSMVGRTAREVNSARGVQSRSHNDYDVYTDKYGNKTYVNRGDDVKKYSSSPSNHLTSREHWITTKRNGQTESRKAYGTMVHPGGTARDMISRRGTQKVQYKDIKNSEGKKQRLRLSVNSDFTKERSIVDKMMGKRDRRNPFKRTVSNIKRTVERGKNAIKKIFDKFKIKDSKKKTSSMDQPLTLPSGGKVWKTIEGNESYVYDKKQKKYRKVTKEVGKGISPVAIYKVSD